MFWVKKNYAQLPEAVWKSKGWDKIYILPKYNDFLWIQTLSEKKIREEKKFTF